MKTKHFFAITLICFLAITLPSCNKYVDGPKLSLRSKKARLCGDWKLEFYSYNDADQTAALQALLGANFKYDIEKDGKYTVQGNFSTTGTWELGEDGDDVMFQSSASGATLDTYRILRLKNKELWWKQTQSNGDVVEMHFVPAD